MRHSDVVLDHFHRPRNAFAMASPDAVGTAGVPGRGNFTRLFLRLDRRPDPTRIEEASFQAHGCAAAIAAGSLLVERLSGASVAEARRWTAEALDAALGGLPRHKKHCARLTAEALEDALGPEAQNEEEAWSI